MLHASDFIVPFANACPDELCDSLITKFEKHIAGTVNRDEEYYKFKELNISRHFDFKDEYSKLVHISNYIVSVYKKELGVEFFPEQFTLEEFRMKRYEPENGDQFDWHVDVGDYASAKRFLVVMFYLNTVEEGGETYFDWKKDEENGIFVQAVKGTGVMFPPFWTMPHKGMPPKSGPKYIVSTYAHYL